MGRRKLKENEDLKEKILNLIHFGHEDFEMVAHKLRRHKMKIWNYLVAMERFGYVIHEGNGFWALNTDVEWCRGCKLIGRRIHPREWCHD